VYRNAAHPRWAARISEPRHRVEPRGCGKSGQIRDFGAIGISEDKFSNTKSAEVLGNKRARAAEPYNPYLCAAEKRLPGITKETCLTVIH
jgi:hypothetical protein